VGHLRPGLTATGCVQDCGRVPIHRAEGAGEVGRLSAWGRRVTDAGLPGHGSPRKSMVGPTGSALENGRGRPLLPVVGREVAGQVLRAITGPLPPHQAPGGAPSGGPVMLNAGKCCFVAKPREMCARPFDAGMRKGRAADLLFSAGFFTRNPKRFRYPGGVRPTCWASEGPRT